MRTRTKIVLALAGNATALLAIFGVGVAVGADDASTRKIDDVEVVDLHCPREDSCAVNYDGRADRWTVQRER